MTGPGPKDLKGRVFGKWTVISYAGSRGGDGAIWTCRCECGTTRTVSSTSLLSGRSRSCGKHKQRPLCKNGHPREEGMNSGGCRTCGRIRRWKTVYGLSEQDYRDLWEFQQGRCAICGKKLDDKLGLPGWGAGARVEIDHDHAKGLDKRESVRGLLCGGRWAGCNRKLGHFKLEWLQAATKYMAATPASQVLHTKGHNAQHHEAGNAKVPSRKSNHLQKRTRNS